MLKESRRCSARARSAACVHPSAGRTGWAGAVDVAPTCTRQEVVQTDYSRQEVAILPFHIYYGLLSCKTIECHSSHASSWPGNRSRPYRLQSLSSPDFTMLPEPHVHIAYREENWE